uniref:Uncharacterized protein n=1 Tax=Oryza barthii TaxID=65489 RepID=A0A0D3HJ27_9ORYZ
MTREHDGDGEVVAAAVHVAAGRRGGRGDAGAEEDGDRNAVDKSEFSDAVRVVVDDEEPEFPSDDDEGGDDDVRVSFATAVGDSDEHLREEQGELDLDDDDEEDVSSLPPLAPHGDGGLAAQLSRKLRARRWKSCKDVLPEHVVVPDTAFALADEPVCSLEGHLDDVLDLAWSMYSLLLLSSSMDKTVRLWDTEAKACLKLFPHNDYVTCVQFNPVDDGYFISGSLDSKVRIWSVAERQVVDWSDLDDMVTAACYTPDGQAAIVGSHKGSCRFYKTADCKLNQEAQIDMNISKKRKSHVKKITGFQFAPGNPSEILVTTADSQIRVFNGITVLQKFKGFKNTSSQISASYSGDGRYVVCASEDSNVYVWRRATKRSPFPPIWEEQIVHVDCYKQK